MIALASAAKALGGDVVRGGIVCPGPGHSRHDRSLAVTLSGDDFLVHSHSGDDWRACRDHVKAVLGLDVGMRKSVQTPLRNSAQAPMLKSKQGLPIGASEAARKLWREAVEPEGTPVASYLAGRGVSLPMGAAGGAVRFHPACPFKGEWLPAMVCLVRDIVTNEPRAIHRTALTPDGRNIRDKNGKALRLSLGPVAGGAIKLTPDAAVTTCLGVGEGVESTLSLRQLPEFGLSPAWALVNASNLAGFPLLAGIECLWIATDADEAGEQATLEAGSRWMEAGREVFAVKATTHKADLNDVVKGAAHA